VSERHHCVETDDSPAFYRNEYGGTRAEHIYGSAIGECYEAEDGSLWVTNGEYGSPVNFCPYCGQPTKGPTIPVVESAPFPDGWGGWGEW